MTRPVIAVKRAEVAIPTITNCKTLREKANVRSDAISAPTAAAIVAPRVPIDAKPRTIAIAAPKLAPADVPMMDGSASGLLVADCESAPATPSAIPTRSAAITRGNRISQMMSWLGPVRDLSKMYFQAESTLTLPTLSAKREKSAIEARSASKRIRRPLMLIMAITR